MADLISLVQYKAIEGITTDKEDTKLTDIITAVSALIKAYCNNSFVDYVSTNKTQKVNVQVGGAEYVFLKELPLISIVTVRERQSYSSSYSPLVENTDFYYVEELEALMRLGASWPAGPASVEIVYKAGYASLPEELILATANLVTHYAKEHYKQVAKNIASTSLNNTIVNYTNMPGHIKRVLDLHRQIV